MAKSTTAEGADSSGAEPKTTKKRVTKKKTSKTTKKAASSKSAESTSADKAPESKAPAGEAKQSPPTSDKGSGERGSAERGSSGSDASRSDDRRGGHPSSSNNASGSGGGGGGGDNRQQQQRQHHQNRNPQNRNQQQRHNQQQGGGKRKKKRNKQQNRGPGSIPQHYLPNDEELDRAAAELEKITGKEYKKAEAEALHISELQRMKLGELHELAREEGIDEPNKVPRQDLIFELLKTRSETGQLMFGEGTLEVLPEGYGFLRSPEASYLASPEDIYVSPSQIRRMRLRKGMEIKGPIRTPEDGEKFFGLLRVDEVNGQDPSVLKTLPIFEDLTPLHPEDRFVLETEAEIVETRVVDLVAPIGRGQRALIVAPPRTGKTVLLQKITQAISTNYPEVKILVLLIDERPEEVTDFRRNTTEGVEVIASTFDEQASRHVQVAEMVSEKARRYVEFGQHVVILLDSITRLARAYNANQPNSGKIMTGGIDSGALTRPKKFFGSARAIEDGGSLTILGTALVDTGSKADEVIFEEFKGTGNSELHLDRKLIEKRVYPAIDISASGTRREELLLDPKELELVYRLRKVLSDMNVVEAMELLKGKIKKTKTNAEFLMTMAKGFG